MSEPPRRKRFQIHLSTVIVLMFVAGGLIWANVRWRRIENRHWGYWMTIYPLGSHEHTKHKIVVHGYGWPFHALEAQAFEVEAYRDESKVESSNAKEDEETGVNRWRILPLIADIVFVAAILGIVRFICERLIRSRSTQKEP